MGSSRLKSRRRQEQGFKWARVAIALLSTIGVIDTGSITLNQWGWIGSLSCPGGANGCDKVLNSAWGTLFQGANYSIPLSLAGFIGYLTILLLSIIPFLPGIHETKNNLSKLTWWGLFFLACSMSAFSLLLLGIMVFKINAFCLFCVISAIISIVILLLTLKGGAWDDPRELIFRGIIISIIMILSGLIWSSSVDPSKPNKIIENPSNIAPVVQSKSSDSAIQLAKYLKEKGAIMYFAYWCKYCALQKELFGKEAVDELALVECAEDGVNNQNLLCKEKGITSYPSWEINGAITSGALSLEQIADLSNYSGPRNF